MKYLIGAVLLVGMGVVVGCSSNDEATPLATTPPATVSATPTPTRGTPTPPAGCGNGDWEQCEKQAVEPAFANLVRRYSLSSNDQLAVVSTERVEWSDSCLGVHPPGELCAPIITAGFRFIIRSLNTPFVEYHTDLSGNTIFAAEYDTLPSATP